MSENKENYILQENQNFSLINFSGEDVHETLTYVKTNSIKFDDSIRMFVAKLVDKASNTNINDTTLSINHWENDGKGHFKKDILVTNTPPDIDYNNGIGVNIIISPTENKGYILNESKIKEESDETSRELYTDYNIRCISYNYDSALNKIILSFMADDQPEYNIMINILVLYNSKNVYSIPKDGEN